MQHTIALSSNVFLMELRQSKKMGANMPCRKQVYLIHAQKKYVHAANPKNTNVIGSFLHLLSLTFTCLQLSTFPPQTMIRSATLHIASE